MWTAGTSAKTKLARQYPAPGQLVDVGGYQLHIYCLGQGGPTVIMDAGLNDLSVSWTLVQSEVAKFTRVCVYDRAGLGWSDPGSQPRTSDKMADELHSLLANADIAGPYVLVGHSFGGVNVRLYAHRYPEQVVGMVLVDSSHEDMFHRAGDAFQTATEQVLGQFRSLTALSSIGLLALAPESIPARGLPGKVLAQYRAILATTTYFETAVAESTAFTNSLEKVRAAQITSLGNLPLIVLSRNRPEPLQGMSEDEVQYFEQTWREMQAELVPLSTNSKQVIAEESGHYIQLEQPQLVIDAIREVVLARNDERP